MSFDFEEAGKRFLANMRRVNGLIDLGSGRTPGSDSLPKPVRDDVLRASIVLMHAAFEDLLRSVGRGIDPEYDWDRSNVGSADVFKKCLTRLNLDVGPFEFLLVGLDALFGRRHEIAHNADLSLTDSAPKQWGIGDDLLLVYWLIHVLTAFHALWAAMRPEDVHIRAAYEKGREATQFAREAIVDLLAVPDLLKAAQASGGTPDLTATQAKLMSARTKLLEAKAALAAAWLSPEPPAT